GSGKVFSVGPYVNPVNNSTTANSELLSSQVEWVYQQEWLDIRKAQTGSNFQVISLDGRVVASGEIGLSGKARVNLSAVSSGVYLFTLTYQGQVMSEKFVR
ncbi:MAG: T9SS type A sorting domain-containing protein, partial [Bacteroidetes bacterium]|nr:T9SS type A sorting domain-containing protein [Bacteroidota bacterium]